MGSMLSALIALCILQALIYNEQLQEHTVQQSRFFHQGEVEVQVASGSDPAQYEQWAARTLAPNFKDREIEFVEGCTFAAAASVDQAGRPWASAFFSVGAQLFTVKDSSVISIACPMDNGDPLLTNLGQNNHLGVLFLDPNNRRRAKSMGRAEVQTDGQICYSLSRYFGLCPKYIHQRSHEPQACTAKLTTASSSVTLSKIDRAQLKQSDTAFLATFFPDHGADVTHRGGNPGFLRPLGDTKVEIPDYTGNGMFNTLGNLRIDSRLALTDIDFVTGRTLHLTGNATVSENVDPNMHPGANRLVTLEVEEVLVSYSPVGTWTDHQASPYNPPLC